MDKAKFIDLFNNTTYDFEATLPDLHAVLDPTLSLSDQPRLTPDEAAQLYTAWRMCFNIWEDAYDEAREHGFSEGYNNGYNDGIQASR